MQRVAAMLGSMEFYLLASGSKGNCFVLKTAATQIVIDCGTTRTYLQILFLNLFPFYLFQKVVQVLTQHLLFIGYFQ